jgi:CubicO group peptidase (beta-lactamase class C family)
VVTDYLYASMVESGELRPETRLSELLHLGSSSLGSVTVDELASHRSGLPTYPGDLGFIVGVATAQFSGSHPFTQTPHELLALARRESLESRGQAEYSNLGFELLGYALARAGHTTYADLVRERVSEPLGLTSFRTPADDSPLGTRDLTGTTPSGRKVEPSHGTGMAPAGGLRSTVADLATFAERMLDDDTVTRRMFVPRATLDEHSIMGADWVTTDVDGRALAWHGGDADGWAAFMGLDRESKTALVLVSSTAGSIASPGLEMLRGMVGKAAAR